MAATLDDEPANLRRINAELEKRLDEALAREAATAEVLQVINASSGNLAPVFDAILEKSMRLSEAAFGILLVRDGSNFETAAVYGMPAALAEFLSRAPREPGKHTAVGRMLAGEDFVQFEDMTKEAAYRSGDPRQRAFVELGGTRTYVAVPLRKDGRLLGTIAAYRQEVRPFSDKEIASLRNFAAQAVIAMENARLLIETREALDQQTATAEVLQVINSSPGDLKPVFQAMLQKAHTLCEASFGALMTYDGERLHAVAHQGTPAEFREFLASGIRPKPGDPFGRIVEGAALSHIHDLSEVAAQYPGEPLPRVAVDLGGIRTLLVVPLRKDNKLLGVITAYRQEVRPFTDKQIALLQNFAAQAVIAMENARLLTETREALEQQTATAEVLQVINSSPGDLAPVFEAILEKAMRLCGAASGHLATWDGECFEAVAVHGGMGGYPLGLRGSPMPGSGSILDRVARGASLIHVTDVFAEPGYDSPYFRQVVDVGGIRTMLFVALRREDALLGLICIYNRAERPFSDQQIALVQNFAQQAVIAMDNARLLTETREALEQQTATAEILQVINSSPGNLAPVFDAMLEKAMRLCGAAFGGLFTYDGNAFPCAALRGLPPTLVEFFQTPYPASGPGTGAVVPRIVAGEEVIQVEDLTAGEPYRAGHLGNRLLADVGGARTMLWVALRKESQLLGVLVMYRQEVRRFADTEIALLKSFAAQAVIAMENARLINETRQAQAELRVTFDNMGDGVVMFDEGQRLAAWNRNFQRLLDLPDAVLAGRPSYPDYLRILAERGEFGAEDIEGELRHRLQDTDQELRLERTRPDGRVIEVRRNAVPDGGFVLIYSDITERKRSEAEIRAARDAAEAAYRDLKAAQASLVQAEKMASLGQLTAGIAHEIKNPLNFVNNFAELSVGLLDELKESAAPAIVSLEVEQRAEIDDVIGLLTGNLEKIAEHGRRADGIVKSMLEHSRGTTGERRTIDLNGLVEDALNLAYHGARAQDASFNITLERDLADAIPPIELVPQDITRVCLNLFSNGFYAATKRGREGGDRKCEPNLKVTTRDLGDAVEIRIRDNGTGIPPEVKDKLFQPFFTTKPTGEGTGLGLSISYDIVTQQHGGTIEFDSRVNEFTEFCVRLPHAPRTILAQAAS